MFKQILQVYILSVFLIGPYTFVLGQECTTDTSAQETDKCVLECIKMIFDQKLCKICQSKSTAIEPSKNNTLQSILLENDYIFFDEKNKTMASSQCLDCSLQGHFERFLVPDYLRRWAICVDHLKQNKPTNSHCNVEDVLKVYHETLDRFTGDWKWCIKTLDIITLDIGSTHIMGLTNAANNSSNTTALIDVNQGDKVVNSTESTEATTTNASVTETTTEDIQSNGTTTPKPDELTTIATINATTLSSTNSTTNLNKPKASKKTKVVEEHHYRGSVYLIAIIVGVLLTVMIISTLILRAYVNRRNILNGHSTSTTYVFEQQ